VIEQLFADCVAAPDDDGPRLVWADAVGGERGELVVLQCDLARGGLSSSERAARKQRERELLDRHAIEWAGEAAHIADRWSFWRGFVETASLPYDRLKEVPRLREVAPLLGTLSIHGRHQGFLPAHHLEALRGLRGLGLVGDYTSEGFVGVAKALETFGLRSLALDGLDRRVLRELHRVLDANPIETLQLRRLRLTARQLDKLLRHTPKLSSLAIEPVEARSELLAVIAKRRLRAFRIDHVTANELQALTDTPLVDTVERLGFTSYGDPILPKLMALKQCDPLEDELLHHDASALLEIGKARYRTAPAFVLLEVANGKVHGFPDKAVYAPVMIGRAMGNDLILRSPMVTRQHARIEWTPEGHRVDDQGGANGIHLNGERVDRAVLADGDEIQIADVRFRYFVGPDARERARAFTSS
jgi:hypothetical protein